MTRFLTTLLVLLALSPLAAQNHPRADALLASSIKRHDPEGAWNTGAFRLVLSETRPDGPDRETTLLIDNGRGRFELSSLRDGNSIVGTLDPEECSWLFNGSPDFSDEIREEHRLTCDRLERMRNYYVYLWGLPMKLRDPGTHLGEVRLHEFEDRPALSFRVTYDEEVGGDIWYAYFDPSSHDLIGYRFYHDEAANDGEYITLEGVQEGAGLRLPRARAWYTHEADKHLGTDTLVAIERE